MIVARRSDPPCLSRGSSSCADKLQIQAPQKPKIDASPFPTDTHSKYCTWEYSTRLHPNTGKQRLGGTCSPESRNQI